MTINVLSMVGENCITLEDGQRIYDAIHPELKADKTVKVDFGDVTVFASPFFNAAFGQLLRDIPANQLNRLLKVCNLSSAGLNVLKRVIENSRQYYSNAANRTAVDEVMTKRAEEMGCR